MSDHHDSGSYDGGYGEGFDAFDGGPAYDLNDGGRRSRRRRRRRSGCIPVLLVVVALSVAGYYLVPKIDVGNPFASTAEDYPGPGSGEVVFEVLTGDSISVQARNLEELGVVASADAYVEAADDDSKAAGIREGVYLLKKEMKAADVVSLLASGETKGASFTFTAGKTVAEIIDLLAKDTDVPRKQLEAAAADGAAIGLPESAQGSAEGYLAPGGYTFFPDDDAVTILKAMVDRTVETLEENDLAGAAKELGYSEHDLLTIASLIQAEGSLLDEKGKSKIARVIYNRLENPTAETVGFLQLDATIDFIYGDKVARRTIAEIDAVADNPYNTYRQKGLPPGPIAMPSADALEAAIAPAKGSWLYYVTVNLATGKTKFAKNAAEFAVLEAELDEYCATKSDRC